MTWDSEAPLEGHWEKGGECSNKLLNFRKSKACCDKFGNYNFLGEKLIKQPHL